MSETAPYPWQSEQWRRLAASRRVRRFPHALLLTGPPGLGKADFARRLSDALVCTSPDDTGNACEKCQACRQSRAGSHPDQIALAPEAPGKMIKIDAVRELSGRSVLTAQEGGYRAFLIDPAEAMNRAAANALLKTLEEPASRTVLLLVSSHPDRLPPTIRSRCQLLRFQIPARALVSDWLRERADSAEVDDLLAISGGAPLRALQALEQGWIEQDRKLSSELDALKRRQTNPLQIVEEWEKRSINLLFDGLKRCLSDLVKLASGVSTAAQIYHPGQRDGMQSLCQDIDLRQLYELNDDLLRLDRNATHNLNAQMMLEHLVNRWLQITRPGGH